MTNTWSPDDEDAEPAPDLGKRPEKEKHHRSEARVDPTVQLDWDDIYVNETQRRRAGYAAWPYYVRNYEIRARPDTWVAEKLAKLLRKKRGISEYSFDLFLVYINQTETRLSQKALTFSKALKAAEAYAKRPNLPREVYKLVLRDRTLQAYNDEPLTEISFYITDPKDITMDDLLKMLKSGTFTAEQLSKLKNEIDVKEKQANALSALRKSIDDLIAKGHDGQTFTIQELFAEEFKAHADAAVEANKAIANTVGTGAKNKNSGSTKQSLTKYRKYQHPDDKSKVYIGTGSKRSKDYLWVDELVNSGRQLIDIGEASADEKAEIDAKKSA